MYQSIAARNARRNRARAIFLTTIITLTMIGGLIYSSHPEWQTIVHNWLDQIMGIAPTQTPTP